MFLGGEPGHVAHLVHRVSALALLHEPLRRRAQPPGPALLPAHLSPQPFAHPLQRTVRDLDEQLLLALREMIVERWLAYTDLRRDRLQRDPEITVQRQMRLGNVQDHTPPGSALATHHRLFILLTDK